MILKNACIDFSKEPVLYQSRTRPTWEGAPDWSPWENCTKDKAQDCWNCPQVHDWIYEARALYTEPPPLKQEPVAWLDEERNIFYMHNTHMTDDYHGFKRTTPLYTNPVEREWIRLDANDYEELRSVVPNSINDFVFCDIIAMVSAKLKEKNT